MDREPNDIVWVINTGFVWEGGSDGHPAHTGHYGFTQLLEISRGLFWGHFKRFLKIHIRKMIKQKEVVFLFNCLFVCLFVCLFQIPGSSQKGEWENCIRRNQLRRTCFPTAQTRWEPLAMLEPSERTGFFEEIHYVG